MYEYHVKACYFIHCLAINPYCVRAFQVDVRTIYDYPIVYELCNFRVTILYVDPYASCRIITLIELSSEHFTENFYGQSVLVFAQPASSSYVYIGTVSDFFTIDIGTG